MIDFSAMSQLLADPKLRSALSRPSSPAGSAGFMTAGAEGSAGNFEGLLAQTLAGGEPGDPDSARDLARLKAAGLRQDMLAGLLNLEGGGGTGRAAGLVERANLEALLSSGRFGNLLGRPAGRLAGRDSGRVFNREELNTWRQKNGPLSLGRPVVTAEDEAGQTAANLGLPYGLIRPPKRVNLTRTPTPAAAPAEPAPVTALAAQPPAVSADEKFTSEKLDQLVGKVALALDLDPNLIKAVIKTESNFDPQ
ncbi:MAG: hypothetical protein LBV21_03725, partial [Candidatus Adiutrix sp.]|nr:hypothetical protein [Candidatus Adiutrix sp.]